MLRQPLPLHGDGMGRHATAGVRPTTTSSRWALVTATIRARRGTGSELTGIGRFGGGGPRAARPSRLVVADRGHGTPRPSQTIIQAARRSARPPLGARSPHACQGFSLPLSPGHRHTATIAFRRGGRCWSARGGAQRQRRRPSEPRGVRENAPLLAEEPPAAASVQYGTLD